MECVVQFFHRYKIFYQNWNIFASLSWNYYYYIAASKEYLTSREIIFRF